MSDKINSHICLMLSVYESFHQIWPHGRQRNYIVQDLTGLEILIYMNASKSTYRFQTGFQQPKSGLQKEQY